MKLVIHTVMVNLLLVASITGGSQVSFESYGPTPNNVGLTIRVTDAISDDEYEYYYVGLPNSICGRFSYDPASEESRKSAQQDCERGNGGKPCYAEKRTKIYLSHRAC